MNVCQITSMYCKHWFVCSLAVTHYSPLSIFVGKVTRVTECEYSCKSIHVFDTHIGLLRRVTFNVSSHTNNNFIRISVHFLLYTCARTYTNDFPTFYLLFGNVCICVSLCLQLHMYSNYSASSTCHFSRRITSQLQNHNFSEWAFKVFSKTWKIAVVK